MADSEELAREAHQSLSTSMRKMASSTVPQRPLNEETQSDDRDRDHFDHQSSSVLSQRPSHSLAAPNNTGPLFSRMCTQAPDQDVSIAHSLATRTHRTQSRTSRTSVGTASFQLPDFEVDFVQNDPENPKDWPLWKRSLTIAVMSFSTWVVVLYSSSYTAGIAGMMEELDVTSKPVATLGVTSYLLGLALGSLVLAPMSEIYGRRLVYMISYALFGILVLPSALATTLQEIIVARFFRWANPLSLQFLCLSNSSVLITPLLFSLSLSFPPPLIRTHLSSSTQKHRCHITLSKLSGGGSKTD